MKIPENIPDLFSDFIMSEGNVNSKLVRSEPRDVFLFLHPNIKQFKLLRKKMVYTKYEKLLICYAYVSLNIIIIIIANTIRGTISNTFTNFEYCKHITGYIALIQNVMYFVYKTIHTTNTF